MAKLEAETQFVFGNLYQDYFGMVRRFVLNNNGTSDDAEDIFQDTMLVMVEKLRLDNFVLTAAPKTYVMAIAKNLWLKKLRKVYRETKYDDRNDDAYHLLSDDEINLAVDQEKSYWDKLQRYMTKITAHCSRLIQDMFFKHKPVEQVQIEYGYSSRHNTVNQKHKCVEQIRRVKEKEENVKKI